MMAHLMYPDIMLAITVLIFSKTASGFVMPLLVELPSPEARTCLRSGYFCLMGKKEGLL
jgi:hypothetical protein